jgi:Ca2+/H+ antiporter
MSRIEPHQPQPSSSAPIDLPLHKITSEQHYNHMHLTDSPSHPDHAHSNNNNDSDDDDNTQVDDHHHRDDDTHHQHHQRVRVLIRGVAVGSVVIASQLIASMLSRHIQTALQYNNPVFIV